MLSRLRARSRRRHRRAGEHGQILVLFTIVVVVLLAMTALVVDLGMLRNNRQTLANALDAGALAAGTMMPVGKDGSRQADVEAVVHSTIQANFPGISTIDYQITYRCMVRAENGVPMIDQQIPIEPATLSPQGATQVCDPTGTLGRRPVPSDFVGAGTKRSSTCDPSPPGHPDDSDKCNVIMITGSVNTPFTFARVVGVNVGNSGAVTTAACNGPCGEPIGVPLDVVMVMDRTYSMVVPTNLISDLRAAGRLVLSIYNPEFQHVAIGLIGPSSLTRTDGSCPSGLHGQIVREPSDPAAYANATETNATSSNVSTLQISRPSNIGGSDLLVATIAARPVASGVAASSINIVPPSGWTRVERSNDGSGTGAIALETFYRIGSGGGSGSYTFNFRNAANTANVSVRASGGIMRFTDVDTSDPISASTSNSGSGTNATANGVSADSDTVVIATYARAANLGIDAPSLSGGGVSLSFSERVEANGNSGPTVSAWVAEADADGDTGNRVINEGTGSWAAQQIAVRSGNTTPEYGVDYNGTYSAGDARKWIPGELTGISTLPGNPRINEAYSDGNGVVNSSARIVQLIDCFGEATPYPGTNLATPIDMAQRYLEEYGREGVQKVIILETDGTPQGASGTASGQNYTCAQTKIEADEAKAANIQIYTIGFFRGGTVPACPDSGLPGDMNDAAELLGNVASPNVIPGRTPDTGDDCTERENGDNDNFYCASSGADLTAVFQRAAMAAVNTNARLVSVYPPPDISSVGPNTGSAAGGATITVTGKNFTGTTTVLVGGAPAAGWVETSDTSLQVTIPPGTSGDTVQIRVITQGGTSPVEDAARFTYTD